MDAFSFQSVLHSLSYAWSMYKVHYEELLRPDILYLQSKDPFVPIIAIVLWFATISFLLGLVTREFSWVDRLWSILPAIYAWLFALHPHLALKEGFAVDSRPTLMAVLVTLWGLRLTYNFARKGGYTGAEDYRWEEVRTWFPNVLILQLFNLVFISFYQNILLFLITSPAYFAWLGRGHGLGPLDYILALVFISFLVLETVADKQQWDFQVNKKAALSKRTSRSTARSSGGGGRRSSLLLAGDLADGFIQTKLWQYSRHPNFFAEICLWWSFYLFSYPARYGASGELLFHPPYLHWTILGAFLLTLLFQASTKLTETLSVRKYPKYKAYQSKTSRLIPWKPKLSNEWKFL